MYDSFYGLKGEPFRLSPDHNMAFAHKRFAKARAYMSYAFMRAEGFVMVTGRPGTGKTTLVGVLKDQLSSNQVTVAKLVCTQVQADDLLRLVCYEFGVTAETKDKGELLQQLTRRLKGWDREGRRALLIVDEAQNLSVSALEELRLLTNLETEGRPLLQIFLLGQTELRDLILRPELEQVHQRLVAATHLEPLEREETEDYIKHRLESVAWRGNPMISKAVYPLIFKFSEGIPRRINLICSRLFLHGAVEQKDRIGVADMRTVVQELQNEGLAAGSHFNDSDFQVADEYERWVDPRPVAAESEESSATGVSQAADAPDLQEVPQSVALQHSELPEEPAAFAESVTQPETPEPVVAKPEAPVGNIEPLTAKTGASTEQTEAVSEEPEARTGEAAHPDGDGLDTAPPVKDRIPEAEEEQPADDRGEAEEGERTSTATVLPALHFPAAARMADEAASDRAVVALKADRGDARERFMVRESGADSDDALVESDTKRDGTLWLFALFLLLSLGLVMWAVTGFKLPFTLDGV